MNTSEFQYPFAAPFVPIADPVDGLLQTADLDRPVPVNVVVWDALQIGVVIQLVLNSERVGDIRTSTNTDKPGDILSFALNQDFFDKNGRYDLAFRATNNENAVSDAPQHRFKKPSYSRRSAAESNHFPAATLGERLTGQMPGYAGMQEGDSIQTVCNGVRGPVRKVVTEELLYQPIHITFERSLLQGLGNETVVMEYFVTDRAGNVSVVSPPVSLTLQI